jgi:small subunit ribosomal protein S19
MSRSSKKGFFIDEHLLKKVNTMNASDKKRPIKT